MLGSPGSAPGQLNLPLGVAVGPGGIYVADSVNDRVQLLGFDGTPRRTYGPSLNGGLSNELDSPRGVAISPANGLLYVASGGSDRILAIDPLTGLRVLMFGGTGSGPGQLELPGGIAIDAAGRVYVADINNHRVQRFSALGQPQAPVGRRGHRARRVRAPRWRRDRLPRRRLGLRSRQQPRPALHVDRPAHGALRADSGAR